jgi:AcrR family transcriptional regulator
MRRALVEAELLEQAARLFAERGFAGTNLQDVAEAMGTTRAALYYYVKNKDELLTRLVEGVTLEGVTRREEIAQDPELDASSRLHKIMAASVAEHATWPARFRLLDRSEGDLPEPLAATHREAKRQTLEQFARVLQEGITAGEFIDVDTRSTALALIGMSTWVAWWFHPGADHPVEPVAALLADLAVRAVRVPTHRHPRGGVAGTLALLREDVETLERLVQLDRHRSGTLDPLSR